MKLQLQDQSQAPSVRREEISSSKLNWQSVQQGHGLEFRVLKLELFISVKSTSRLCCLREVDGCNR